MRLLIALNRPRIAQLINKSNQFNLTSKRYSEPAVAAIESDPSQAHVSNPAARSLWRFWAHRRHDRGCDPRWQLGCRYLADELPGPGAKGRVVDAQCAGRRGELRQVPYITATYRPTAKNSMVAEHYDNLGFSRTSVGEDGAVSYRLSVADFIAPKLPLRIED